MAHFGEMKCIICHGSSSTSIRQMIVMHKYSHNAAPIGDSCWNILERALQYGYS